MKNKSGAATTSITFVTHHCAPNIHHIVTHTRTTITQGHHYQHHHHRATSACVPVCYLLRFDLIGGIYPCTYTNRCFGECAIDGFTGFSLAATMTRRKFAWKFLDKSCCFPSTTSTNTHSRSPFCFAVLFFFFSLLFGGCFSLFFVATMPPFFVTSAISLQQ